MAVKRVTRQDLAVVVAYWQDVLRLRDWEIDAAFVSPLVLGDALGQSQIDLLSRRASIRLAETADVVQLHGVGYDWQETLIHEMLHCHFEPFCADEDAPEYVAQEQALNMLASAFWRLHAA
jgi:hypothetical protein